MDYSGKIIKKTPVTPSQTSASGVWTLDDAIQAQKTNTWPVANVPNPISRSLRFRSSASAYLSRTFGTPTNQKIWTWSAWVKRGSVSAQMGLFGTGNGSTSESVIVFNSSGKFIYADYISSSYTSYLESAAVFRDPSAWYHVVVAYDTTQATNTNRIKLYVNGSQITQLDSGSLVYPSLNYSGGLINTSTYSTVIGREDGFGNYFDGYMTEINFIDGQQLTPSSFGGTNAVTGVWEPRAYTGTYGTNGFYLNFKDNTSTGTLGYDYSGNGNNWTANNISLTAGSTYDSMLDVPTQWIGYGNAYETTRGNYCTLNPLDSNAPVNAPSQTITNGNLKMTNAVGQHSVTRATIAASSGKFYWEIKVDSITNFYSGICKTTADLTTFTTVGSDNTSWAYVGSNGDKRYNATTTAYGSALTAGDVLGCALDLDNGKVWWSVNGTWQASGNPATGTNPAFTGISGDLTAAAGCYTSTINYNFGQQPFAYTPPSGYLPLCTTNLSSPTILQGDDYFNAVTWTGANTSAGNSVTGVGFKPDFVWAKVRSQAYSHLLYDALRGTGATAELSSDQTVAEGGTSASERGYLNSFDSDGFSSVVGSNGDNLYFNQTSQTYVAWNWKASNAAGVSNTSGSITSTVSANQTSGFSIVTYTGNGTNGATVGHGLGVAPAMMIIKTRSAVNSWVVYHQSLGNTKAIYLNLTGAADTNSSFWNNTSPTSSVLTLGTDTICNQNGTTYVAYCFAAVAGYSAFGSYTGNGSSDGPFIYTGFRPRYVVYKRTDSTGGWNILDTARTTYNVMGEYINANLSDAAADATIMDFTSNGFKMRNTFSSANASGGSYIYFAFAENPFKNALAR